MTRTEFVRTYALDSGHSDEWACIGMVEAGQAVLVALPCGCGGKRCEGWAMLSAEAVLDHLLFNAPDALKDAYRKAVKEAGGE